MNLKQLAESLGLSQTTVSRALNGYPEVSEATRNRVQAAALRHNYRPNTRARGLATGKSHMIGHVIPISTKHEMMNPVFSDFIAGAGDIYSRAGYDMTLSIVPDDSEDDAYRALAQKKAVDGIVIHGPRSDERRIRLLQDLDMPFVVHGRASAESSEYSWVDVNNRRAFARATQLLLDLGHRRIAFINGLEDMDFAIRRRQGFEKALSDRGMTPDPAIMAADEMTEQNGYAAAEAMLSVAQAPTAFLVSSLISAIGVRRAIEDAGLRMGRDVSVITHDDELSYLGNGRDVPIFTATRSSVREAGRLAAETLLDLIDDPHRTPRHHLLEAELMLGRSTGPTPAPANHES
ncbi:LacI family DNA-binding transcriptional regulator [Nioella nitratireducens]|uniref:LacI family DNA-binding transcriptional regulator n=1 Tax=Nioella nitratireducens TaxID=1287720 RepID=UPI0008FD47A5|nr:substrate-binding domain-containing protein [Nioella nitratireducens]